MIKRSVGEYIFDTINVILLLCIAFITLYPFWYVLVASLSNPDAVAAGRVYFWPAGELGNYLAPWNFEWSAYERVMAIPNIWTAYGNTIYITVMGTLISLSVMSLGAYALSKKRLRGRTFFTWIMIITMWFNAGTMPMYLNFKNLGLLDNRWALILGFAVSAFYVILLRTYFENVSDSLEESAKMDGANDWLVFFRIYLPLSVPALMTVGLYCFVDRWNAYLWAMILLKDQNKIPLQVLLRSLVVKVTMTTETMVGLDTSQFNEQTIVYATIMVAVIPMLLLYPFIQRFFVKGIMLGAVKG